MESPTVTSYRKTTAIHLGQQRWYRELSNRPFFDGTVVAAIMAIGFGFRAIGLSWESIWYDEACSLKMASASFHDLLSGDELDVGNPCGYFVLLRVWCLMFGFTIESARMFSAVTDVGSIAISWILAMTITKDRRIAGTAAMLVAINPALVFLAREARGFGLLTTLVTTLAYLTEKVLQEGRKRYWFGLTTCCIVLPHLHYYMLFVLVMFGLPLVLGRADERRPRLLKFVAMGLVSLLFFLPWSPNFFHQLTLWTFPDNPWMKHAAYFPVFSFAGRTLVWKQDGLMMMIVAQVVVVGGIYLPAMTMVRRVARRIRVPAAIATGVMFLAIVLSLFYDSLLNCRYLSPVIPCVIVAWSVAIWSLPKRMAAIRWISISLACLIAFGGLGRMYAKNHKDDWRGIASMIASRGPDTPVVFYEDIGEDPFLYYRPQQSTERVVVRFDGDGSAWSESGVEDDLSRYRDFWLCLWTLDDWDAITAWMDDRYQQTDQVDFGRIQLRRYSTRNAEIASQADAESLNLEGNAGATP